MVMKKYELCSNFFTKYVILYLQNTIFPIECFVVPKTMQMKYCFDILLFYLNYNAHNTQ